MKYIRKNNIRQFPTITAGWLAPVRVPGSTAFPTLNIMGAPIRMGGMAGIV